MAWKNVIFVDKENEFVDSLLNIEIMEFLTNEKLTIVGAAGMIGSNMAQTAIMMHLTPNICLYDPYAPGLEGVAEEMFHCGFEGLNLTFTSDIKEALTDAKYVISSGGAARKAGMTREDLLKGNAAIAEEFGKNVKAYCPDVKHVVVIFNPADIVEKINYCPKIAVSVFANNLIENALKKYPHHVVAYLKSANGKLPFYCLKIGTYEIGLKIKYKGEIQ